MKNTKTCPLNLNKVIVTTLALFSTQTWSLVDYTETSSFKPRNSGAQRVKQKSTPAPSARVTRRAQSSSSPRTRSGLFSTALYYQNDNIKLGETSGNVSRMGVNAHFETPYNIYLDARYSQAKLDSSLRSDDEEGASYQAGNPEVLVGFNWLEFGSQMEAAHIDFLGGLSLGQSDSLYATQRTDKIVGISTAKRFYEFALGLGYQLIITGNADSSELAIGNISKLTASLGWVISQDIRFLVEANSYSIARSTDELSTYKLDEKAKVSVISPQLILGISPLVDMTLGAHMATRRLQDDRLLGAKLWNIDGLYGNALYVKMGINL